MDFLSAPKKRFTTRQLPHSLLRAQRGGASLYTGWASSCLPGWGGGTLGIAEYISPLSDPRPPQLLGQACARFSEESHGKCSGWESGDCHWRGPPGHLFPLGRNASLSLSFRFPAVCVSAEDQEGRFPRAPPGAGCYLFPSLPSAVLDRWGWFSAPR